MKRNLILLLFIICACEQKPTEYPIELFLKDSIFIQKNKISLTDFGNISYSFENNESILYCISAQERKAYRISAKDSAQRLTLLEGFLEEKNIFASVIADAGTVYSLKNSQPQILFLTDINGTILNEWKLQNLINSKGDTLAIRGISNGSPILIHDSFLYMYPVYIIYDEETFNKYNEHDFLAYMKFHKDSVSLINTFGNIPPKHRDVYLGSVFGNCNSTLFGNKVLLSYSISNDVYIYEKGILKDSFYLGSRIFKKTNENFNEENSGNKDVLSEFGSKHYGYYKILCNSNYIIRTLMNPYKLIDVNGNLTPPAHGSWNIIVADTNYNIMKEIHVSDWNLSPSSLIQTEHGVYIRSIKKPNIFYYYEIFP